jgi:hypothetical protein
VEGAKEGVKLPGISLFGPDLAVPDDDVAAAAGTTPTVASETSESSDGWSVDPETDHQYWPGKKGEGLRSIGLSEATVGFSSPESKVAVCESLLSSLAVGSDATAAACPMSPPRTSSVFSWAS